MPRGSRAFLIRDMTLLRLIPPHNPASSYGITVWNGEAHSLNFAEQ